MCPSSTGLFAMGGKKALFFLSAVSSTSCGIQTAFINWILLKWDYTFGWRRRHEQGHPRPTVSLSFTHLCCHVKYKMRDCSNSNKSESNWQATPPSTLRYYFLVSLFYTRSHLISTMKEWHRHTIVPFREEKTQVWRTWMTSLASHC